MVNKSEFAVSRLSFAVYELGTRSQQRCEAEQWFKIENVRQAKDLRVGVLDVWQGKDLAARFL